jgi:hypothetical protein
MSDDASAPAAAPVEQTETAPAPAGIDAPAAAPTAEATKDSASSEEVPKESIEDGKLHNDISRVVLDAHSCFHFTRPQYSIMSSPPSRSLSSRLHCIHHEQSDSACQ